MNKFQEYMKVKFEKKIEARESNRKHHEKSIRHAWKPASHDELHIKFTDLCQSIDCIPEKNQGADFDGKKKLIKFLRENTQLKYSANKLRMFYHMHASGTNASHINGYKSCMKLLRTWEKIYGKQWEGEPYHIDHIIPLSLASSKSELRNLNRLSNLCMLYPSHNLSKSNKFPHPIYILLKGKLND